MTANRPGRWFPTTLMVVVSTAFGLTLAELGLRMVGFEFALYPSAVQFGWPDPITLREIYRADRDLLWVPKRYRSKVERAQGSRPSIVFMGDSCTQFGRYDEALVEVIRQRDPEAAFSFVNVGVGGWSSYQGMRQLERDVLPMRPRVVTIYYGWNDHWTSFGIEDKEIGKFNLRHPALLIELSRLRVVQLVNRSIFGARTGYGDPEVRRPERVSLDDFGANLRRMVMLAREHDVTPVLITAPSAHERGQEPPHLARRWLNDLDDLVPIHEAYVEKVREIARDTGALLLDLYAEFQQIPRERWDEIFTGDGIHLTEQGNRRVAELLYATLVHEGVYPRLVGTE